MIFSRTGVVAKASVHGRGDIAVATIASPYLHVYPWSSGFGTKYADPATTPTGAGRRIGWSRRADALAIGHTTSPYVTAYPWTVGTGFGTKYADPATTPPGSGRKPTFARDDSALVVGNIDINPRVQAYPWSSSGFGTKYADPATLPSNNTSYNDFAVTNNYVAMAVTDGADNLIAYAWSSGWGSRLTNPAGRSGEGGQGCQFSPDGNHIAQSTTNSPFIHAWAWSGSSFGTKYSNPASLPAGGNLETCVCWTRSTNAVGMAHDVSPYVSVYPWSSGFGTKYANPATALPGRSTAFWFSSDDAYVAIGSTASPYLSVYAWNAGFGSKLSDPASGFTNICQGVQFTYTH